MRLRPSLALAALAALAVSTASAEPLLRTERWDNNDEACQRCDERIAALHGRNLLARKQARLVPESSTPGGAYLLTDGHLGERGGEGRVFIDGRPSVITFYLGEPKTIKEVGVFSCNIDRRANQDYEVRFANNADHPGQLPVFPEKPQLTSGDAVLGADGGAFHSSWIDPAGGPLLAAKADWVQFRVWRTYNVPAGSPAKEANQAEGAASWVEIEVLGEEHDVVVPSPQELARLEAIRTAPKEPEYVRNDTWQATLVASRDSISRWEAEQDLLALPDSPLEPQGWYTLGPLPPKSDLLKQFREGGAIDFTRPYRDAEGREWRWQRRDDLGPEPLDLGGGEADRRNDVLLAACPVKAYQEIDRRTMSLALSADRGRATWLPARQGHHVQSPPEIVRDGQDVRLPMGDHVLLVELQADGQGRRRFAAQFQANQARPGAGDTDRRWARRQALWKQVHDAFSDPVSRLEMAWMAADSLWLDPQRNIEEWRPGQVEAFLAARLPRLIDLRLRKLEADLGESAGIKAQVLAGRSEPLKAWVAELRQSLGEGPDLAGLQAKYRAAASLGEAIDAAARVRSMQLAVDDQAATFGADYPHADAYRARIAALERETDATIARVLAGGDDALGTLLAQRERLDQAAGEILLANPVLQFEKLLLVKGGASFATNWGGPNTLGGELVVLSPVRPDGQQTTLHRGRISSVDVHWDGRRILFSDGQALWEIQSDGSGLRRVSAEQPPVTRYDGCYLPGGEIACVSNSCEQAVPCTGEGNVGNMHLMAADGTGERRVTFDQDHNWNPTVLNDGRVLYTRWEYTDTPHYFTRLLFRMNPDGSGQMEYYGSNSYWPNAMYWPRPVPGHPTMISCIVSGHHGVSRVGEFLLLDPARGRHEGKGVVQRIPGYGKPVEPVIEDQLVVNVWPRFAAPYPLAEPGTNRGAGKYFLVCKLDDAWSTWDLYLADVFDNLTPILQGGYMTPIPLRPRAMPPVIPSRLEPGAKEALVYLADIYQGPGLAGYPRGSIKALRVGSHHYRYPGNGDTRASSYEGGWDVKKILGTVPVNDDGSALFRIPANTPVFVQPLDAEGKSQQVMRSWFVGLPGEVLSCVGCHERQNEGPPSRYTASAMGQRPSAIEPWHGPARGFSFDREVQPVLDRRCVGCHDGRPQTVEGQSVATLDLRAKRLHADFDGPYSPAYMALQPYVRRAGYEADYHVQVPSEWEADTSALVQLLKKGHHNVRLEREEWERLYTWIDFNVPYPLNWRESHRPPADDQVARRIEYKRLFAGIDDRDEESLPLPPVAGFEPPAPEPPRPEPLALEGWPFSSEEAASRQQAAGPAEIELALAPDVTMKFRLIPAGRFVMGDPSGAPDERAQAAVAIDRPFYLAATEVTNAQYACFDPAHDSAYVDGRGKDRTTRGTPINAPDQPVVRVTWNDAMAFCDWLGQRSGKPCTLPTEAQWEWACRAGSAEAYAFGPYDPGRHHMANVADGSVAGWNYGRTTPGYHDGAAYTAAVARYPANAWGLYDMHGNVAEWCLTADRPYPYRADGRDDPSAEGARVVRGGNWLDTLRQATSASRWRYQPYQRGYTVGFRVALPAAAAAVSDVTAKP